MRDIHLVEVSQPPEEESASDYEDETDENLPSSEINEIVSMCSKVKKFVENNHSEKADVIKDCNLFNGNALSHFCEILKKWQKM